VKGGTEAVAAASNTFAAFLQWRKHKRLGRLADDVPRRVPHYAEWELKGPKGGLLGRGDELSGVDVVVPKGKKLSFPEQSWLGHTEGKIISDLIDAGKLGKGKWLTISGKLPPCPSCQRIMEWTSKQFGTVIEYVDETGKTWLYFNGVLQ